MPKTEVELSQAMLRDQPRLRAWQRNILREEKRGNTQTEQKAKWQKRFEESIALRNQRRRLIPDIRLDEQLPIAERASDIQEAIGNHQVVVVSGETGSGKSTQLPLICLQLGLGIGGVVGHTQPRRIAARGVASRVAQQMPTKLGELVGYKIRFSDQTNSQTLIKLMTDGILLAETGMDRFLNQYEVIIVDEAHERSLNIDFLLGYLKQLLPQRPDLKLIITSATIDTRRFADHFTIDPETPVPIIDVEGRTFPVDLEYRPPGTDREGARFDQDMEQAAIDAVNELAAQASGDMLIFLPTEQDIRNLAEKLRSQKIHGHGGGQIEILPLYARLSTEQQNQVFSPGKSRRIVLATNVAESSITVPRIRYVIDTGTARISRWAPRSKVQRLPIEAVSQASADQRAGRCGRIGPGKCVRLYSEEDFQSRPKFTTPEIRRTNLASVILQTKALKLGPIEEFPFVEPPRAEAIRDGYRTLHEIGAVDDAHNLTPLGRQLSRLPVDPRIGRMMVAASENGCLAEVLVIASALEIQDPRVRPAESQAAADAQHAKFKHPSSDFLGYLAMWEFVHELKEKLSRSQFRKACSQNYLSYMLVQQWMDIYRQLRMLVRENNMQIASDRENDSSIHISLMSGLLSGVAMQTERREYIGGGGTKFQLWPGSGVVEAPPKWVLVTEIIETARRYGRTVAKINPAWIEPLAMHLCKRSYSEPHWSKKRQSATAYEKVTLFGLPIVNRRPIRYGPIDPELSRRLLVEQGLAEDQMRTDPPFLVHNRSVIEQLEQLLAKTRQRELILDASRIREFYDTHVPDDAVDAATLNAILKRQPELDQALRMNLEDLLRDPSDGVDGTDYPDSLAVGNLQLPLRYRFAPGSDDDGVSIQVPVEAISQIHENHLGWLIPGLLEARIVALIRALPKPIRRLLVPAPDTARLVAERVEFGKGSFWQSIAHQLGQIAQQPITADMFDQTKLDEFLQLNVQVCDEQGTMIAQARDLGELKSSLPDQTRDATIEVAGQDDWHQDDLRAWTWGELPKKIMITSGVTDVPVFPTVVDAGDSVRLRLLKDPHRAKLTSQLGVTRLFAIEHRKAIRSQVNWLPDVDRLSVLASPLFVPIQSDQQQDSAGSGVRVATSHDLFKQAVSDLIARLAFVEGRTLPRSPVEYAERNEKSNEQIGFATQRIAPWLSKFLHAYQSCRVELEELPDRFRHAHADVQIQFAHLFRDGFMSNTAWMWLENYPRYLNSILFRLDRLRSGSLDRDRAGSDEIRMFWDQYNQRLEILEAQSAVDEHHQRFGWMIQELHVSLFSQQLGTCEPISAKRLEKQWKKVTQI